MDRLTLPALAIGIVFYLWLVHALRHARAKSLHVRTGILCMRDYRNMTADQAQMILRELTELEFPKMMGLSIVFALFKTYGLPSVSSLLVATGELASAETASKRTADTGVLLLEFALNKPSSKRFRKAVARMNFLHSRYQNAGRITNEDMLYTLSVFALEPVRWVQRFEWRVFTDLEYCASGTYWKALGDAMEIKYDPIASHGKSWNDGFEWLQALQQWSVEYEKSHMEPAETNGRLAAAHLEVLCINIPPRLTRIVKQVVSVILGEHVRRAMLLPEPSTIVLQTFTSILNLRRFILRHLTLPRPEMLRKDYISARPEPDTGRYSSKEYLSHPWYVKPTFKRRWGLRAWVTWLLGRKLPGDDGNRYAPEGYLIPEVGPYNLKGKGIDEMEKIEERLLSIDVGSCPFRPAS